METFEYKGKMYNLEKRMTFGEVTELKKITRALVDTGKSINTDQDFFDLDVPQQIALIEKSDNVSEQYSQLMVNVLHRCLNMSREELNATEFLDAVAVFGMVHQKSTNLKKKSEEPLKLPTSPTTLV